MKDITNKNSKNYIPKKDRIATFDMDGTFVGELYPSYFEYNLLEYRGLDDPTYIDKDESVVDAATKLNKSLKRLVKYQYYHLVIVVVTLRCITIVYKIININLQRLCLSLMTMRETMR